MHAFSSLDDLKSEYAVMHEGFVNKYLSPNYSSKKNTAEQIPLVHACINDDNLKVLFIERYGEQNRSAPENNNYILLIRAYQKRYILSSRILNKILKFFLEL